MIENFFIGGLSQETLAKRVQAPLKMQVNIEPEVLFSLYEPEEEVQPFLQFVFPSHIDIVKSKSKVKPKFFTFMSTNCEGMNTYFHCLTFFEKFS